ncbi:DEAD/DEAH box helicase [Alteromonas sp. 07-89-2]|uniref:DEAD/DEAH box helicase n=1 Tax=Alteromonas sp. 07-89-2 TaxID=2607609 RepID=UPI00148CF6F4|nr:DEAD/DEAH box helicase [Alteromonas sp. 07-89-2]NOH56620.1 DEAD/DEAH box helicase [Alteromonas sp. 07-89-2]
MSLSKLLERKGFQLIDSQYTSYLYSDAEQQTGVILDTQFYGSDKPQYRYHEYTGWQNMLMHKFTKLYRFIDDQEADNKWLFDTVLGETKEEYDFKQYGTDRHTNEIDPTKPEYNFESLFEQVYGSKYLYALTREYQYIDLLGKSRYVDYVLKTQSGDIAIELNGEAFHHPLVINRKRYLSQLLKQNSLMKDGIKVYRWSNAGMADEKKFADQIRLYFGTPETFCEKPSASQFRHISFSLFKHQEDALSDIQNNREAGKDTFLLILPTGTGKTEVFIADHHRQRKLGRAKRALVIVPFKDLRNQTKSRFLERNPSLIVSSDITDTEADVIVQTTQAIQRSFFSLSLDYFDYIVVDEAHHAPAQGLKRVLEHFKPKTLLGCTATDKRLDQKDLAEIFGRYQINMTLEEAIKQNLLPPIRAFRLESNIDFSQVRFNGKEFVKSDLNKNVIIPSRDQLIVDVISKYFSQEDTTTRQSLSSLQGVIFCVDVKHANRLADLLNKHMISAEAVSANSREGLQKYKDGKLRFLCACDLLNEGWDAPNTSIVVMARPTMSKVLYMQQLGRGTRNHPGKEALYVVDVVDSYGPVLQPWSLHSIFNLTDYKPFADVFNPNAVPVGEEIVLDHLHESVRILRPIKLFNFEDEFGDYVNDEQLARELFVSTGTVKNWVKNQSIAPDKQLPFGNKMLNYYKQSRVHEIREAKNLKLRSEATRRDDFLEFLEQRDYTFSFKIIFLLLMLKHADKTGEVSLTLLRDDYQSFYKDLLTKYGKAEKPNSPLNKGEFLNDKKQLTKSILQNPFEKFERKSFMYHAKDLDKLAFDAVLWEKLESSDIELIRRQMLEDGKSYFDKNVEGGAFKKELFSE